MNQIHFKSAPFNRAVEKAIAKKPFVSCGKKAGQYFVAASDGVQKYQVSFQVSRGGSRQSSCNCAGGMKGLFCYHQAAALIAHCGFVRAKLRPPAPTPPMPVLHHVYRGSESVRNLI